MTRQHAFFLLRLYALLFIAGAGPLGMLDQETFFLFLNQYHHPSLDYCFYYLTWLGDAHFLIPFVALLWWQRISLRQWAILGSSFVMISAIVHGLKRLVFAHCLRPSHLLTSGATLQLVEGVKLHTYYSFPSGHAAVAFMLAYYIHSVVAAPQLFRSIVCVLLAALVAYSRVYLCQHFYTDVYVGALIATLVTPLMHLFFTHWEGPDWLAPLH